MDEEEEMRELENDVNELKYNVHKLELYEKYLIDCVDRCPINDDPLTIKELTESKVWLPDNMEDLLILRRHLIDQEYYIDAGYVHNGIIDLKNNT